MSKGTLPAVEVLEAAFTNTTVNKGPYAMSNLVLIKPMPTHGLRRLTLIVAPVTLIFNRWVYFIEGVTTFMFITPLD